MFYNIKSVVPLDDFILSIEFQNSEWKRYDVKQLFDKWDDFKALTQNELFKYAKVDIGGYAIVWNDDLDISCNELWENGYKNRSSDL